MNALRLMSRSPGGAAVVVVAGEKAPTSPRWTADGRLYFLSGKSGTQQVWRRERESRLAQITAFPLDVTSFRLAPDGRSLVAIIDAARIFPMAGERGHGPPTRTDVTPAYIGSRWGPMKRPVKRSG